MIYTQIKTILYESHPSPTSQPKSRSYTHEAHDKHLSYPCYDRCVPASP